MAEGGSANPLVLQFRRTAVPRELRLLAAQGALPLTTADLVELLQLLTADSDMEISLAATASLGTMPASDLVPIVKDRTTAVGVLAWAAAHRGETELLEVLLQNSSLPDESVEALAGTLPENLAELVVINQVRLLRRTSLLEALEGNATLNNDQRRRLRELRETFRIGQVPPAPPPAPPPPAEEEEVLTTLPEEEVAVPRTESEALVHYLSEEGEAQDTEKVSAVQRLYGMGVAEKVVAALRGTRQERAVLVRDPNRIVASAVLGSPRLTEAEIESFAAMKSLSEETLRQIGSHREWTKRYGVISNLVRNPRTPVGITLPLIARLNARDIKSLAADRNVAEVLRRHAQKFVRSAHQPAKR
ncbi:MAG TPA: hypothetical protein VII13_10310 [Vicinamibacteria bacterium]|jgi:hypothetical protein